MMYPDPGSDKETKLILKLFQNNSLVFISINTKTIFIYCHSFLLHYYSKSVQDPSHHKTKTLLQALEIKQMLCGIIITKD